MIDWTTENIKTATKMRNFLTKICDDVQPVKVGYPAFGPFDRRQELNAIIIAPTTFNANEYVQRQKELILDILDVNNQYLNNDIEVTIGRVANGLATIRIFGPKRQKNPVEVD